MWLQFWKTIKTCPEGGTLGVRFFTAFCNHWRCTCAMVLSLPCSHWQFLLGFSAMAKQNQNNKKNKKPPQIKTTQKKNKKTEPWGLQDLQWVWFLCFFLFFWFSPKESPIFFWLVQWFFKFSARDPPQRVSEYCCVFVCMKMYVWICTNSRKMWA